MSQLMDSRVATTIAETLYELQKMPTKNGVFVAGQTLRDRQSKAVRRENRRQPKEEGVKDEPIGEFCSISR